MLQPILCLSLLLFVTAVPALAGIDESKLVDLTYPLDERTVFWPSNKPFTWEKSSWVRPHRVTGMRPRSFPCLNMEARTLMRQFISQRGGRQSMKFLCRN